MDYKDTLNLSQSNFQMRGNLPQNEPALYKKWADSNIFEKICSANEDSKCFNIHDGPPYANGHLHIGHALNKILKDIITKYHYFSGDKISYTPGWDCHGLPIEQQVEQNLNKSVNINEFRELCRKHAEKFIKIQKDEFLKLGVIGDFNNPYITMDYYFESKIFEALVDIAKKGILAQRHKPIYWSWACKTALAEAEVEYKEKESYSVFVSFNLGDKALEKLNITNGKIIIWTTTPWTLPANVAIALKPNEKYIISNNGFIVAKALYDKLKDNLKLDSVLLEFNSNTLENMFAVNPLNGRESRIILADYVSLDDGSGAVHTATGHGEDDYFIGLKYGLEVLMPVDDSGNFDDSIVEKKLLPQEFVGVNVFDAQEKILELLGSSLISKGKIIHSYPHCWRSHKPVIYRATTQWFILMDKKFHNGKTLREIALDEIKNVNFYPQSGYNRLKAMIENRPDWCISRQRLWGVPIAFFHYKDSNEPIIDDEIFNHLIALFAKEGFDCWWERDVAYLLPKSWLDKADKIYKGMHILDVWFDSGSTWFAVLDSTKYNAGSYPSSMYLEGSDQHRGWFQSSLLISCAIKYKAPFKSVLTHGFTVDDNNEKMSKSKGNVILPDSVLKEYGSEILRLWVALSDYQSDLKISSNILKQVSEQYRKIRNTIRFLLANTNDFTGSIDYKYISPIDKWILCKVVEVSNSCSNLFAKYEFSKAFQIVMNFISNELSGIYFDLCKDILYCESKDSKLRIGVQITLALIAKKLFYTLAPTLTYTINEAISFAPNIIKDTWNSVFDVRDCDIKIDFVDDFSLLLEMRALFGVELDKLKKDKLIKSSLELNIATSNDKYLDLLDRWLIVSNVTNDINNEVLSSFQLSDNTKVYVMRSHLHKCPRCWKFNSILEGNACFRCEDVLKNC